MCGIYASPTLEQTMLVLGKMLHRGPDDSRVRVEGGFAVGLNRLSIVDSAAPEATQPMRSAKGRIIAFNGELYNYRMLDPQAKSEVVLLAEMLDAGLDPRQHLDGDYAILSYEPSHSRVTLYRDRFGFCPLYYQLKPFPAVSSERRQLDPRHVREVPAHGKVVIDLRPRARLRRVDKLPHYGATSELHSFATIRDTLVAAVESRALHSDAGFSVSFSGGLDSSLIVYVLDMLKLRPAAYLTTYFDEKSEDLRCARIVAARLGFALTELRVGGEDAAERAQILKHLDSTKPPTALRYRGGLRTWAVAKNSPTRVVLCGDGADELVGGYPHHFWDSSLVIDPPYMVNKRCLTSIRSMPSINLDRTNKLAMAHSKEFRSPFLASTLSYLLLSQSRIPHKNTIRALLRSFGAPAVLCDREKYSADELAMTEVPA